MQEGTEGPENGLDERVASTDLAPYTGPLDALHGFAQEREQLEEEKRRREAQIKAEFRRADHDVRRRFVELVSESAPRILDLDAAIAAVYWHVDIPVAWIADGFGISSAKVHTYAGNHPLPVGAICRACGRQESVSSRSERDAHSQYGRRIWPHDICPTCWPNCIYCKRPLGEGNDAEWYLKAIRDGLECWHLGCEPKEEPKSRKEQYADYLQSDHWRSVREWALERAGNRCQVCNAGRDERVLHVHHRTYKRVGSERPEDLIVLCDSCHDTFHREGRLA